MQMALADAAALGSVPVVICVDSNLGQREGGMLATIRVEINSGRWADAGFLYAVPDVDGGKPEPTFCKKGTAQWERWG